MITDIHGNLPALEASLAAIDALGVDALYCGGDLVGYGPHPNEVCAADRGARDPDDLRQLRLRDRPRPRGLRLRLRDQHDRELGQQSVAWTLAHTDQPPRTSCAGCRSICASRSARSGVRLVHGSPRKVNEYLFEDKPARHVRAARRRRGGCDVLVFGHTHKPWIHEYGGVLFVNCGSVGKPKDGDPRAAFAVLERDAPGGCAASIERVPYDAEAVAARGRGRRPAGRVRRQARRRRVERRE